MARKITQALAFAIAATLLFPVFVQLSAGIYRDLDPIYDSRGILWSLPLPMSILACLVGILAHWRDLGRAKYALVFTACLVGVMAVSFAFAGGGHGKLMYAAQTLLPVLGLVLGMLLGGERAAIAKAFLWVLLVLLPLQLLAGWLQGGLMLTNYMYVFSIYQHIQFVPVVLAVAFGFVMVHLWKNRKRLMLVLSAVAGVYVLASGAFLAIGFYAGFMLLFCGWVVLNRSNGRAVGFLFIAVGVAVAMLLGNLYYGNVKAHTDRFGNASAYVQKFRDAAQGKLPSNMAQRVSDWKQFSGWIAERPVFGHDAPPVRSVTTSAHNWYLDFVYNFGVIGLLPVLGLIGFTTWRLLEHRRAHPVEVWWLVGLVAFMVLVDSSFKVTLRQPYPGIFTYFLWGLLLWHLSPALNAEGPASREPAGACVG